MIFNDQIIENFEPRDKDSKYYNEPENFPIKRYNSERKIKTDSLINLKA